MGKRLTYEERLWHEIQLWARVLTAAGKGKVRFVPRSDSIEYLQMVREEFGLKKMRDGSDS